MKHLTRNVALALLALLGGALAGCTIEKESKLRLHYTSPADSWMEYSLPIGNGQLGASLFGGVEKDRILFNEKTLWTGSTGTSGDYTCYGDNVVYGSYQVYGNLYAQSLDEFARGADSIVHDYERSLDLERGIGKVRYTSPDRRTKYKREYFVSYPDQCIVARYKADGRDGLNLLFTMESGRPGVDAETIYKKDGGYFRGQLNTLSYAAAFLVEQEGGELVTTAEGIEVHDADEVTVMLMAATDYDPYSPTYTSETGDLAKALRNELRTLSKKSYKKLRKRHIEDFAPLMGRVTLDLGGYSDLPTDSLVERYATASATSPEALLLEELYFHYGRYLEISSSRGVDLPSNLQGIWNDSSTPAWHCDLHANINVQMNYWPAEAGNMSEMHERFTNYIWNMACNHPEWQLNAREYAGQTQGWTMFTENNIFGGGSVFQTNYVIANAWYCAHLWQHYLYTLDRDFLSHKALPTMWSCCQFWLERLQLAADGTFECPAEYSPEHGPHSENATAHAQQLVASLFDNTLKAIETLGEAQCGIAREDIETLRDRNLHLDRGLAIEQYDGRWGTEAVDSGAPLLREWKYSPFSVGENHHRHVSHLMCLYPLGQITPDDGELFQAAINSMRLRGDASTGWSMGWKVNLWARALDGDRAHSVLRTALRHSTGRSGGIYYNLYDSHPPFQIDGNFGACAGIIEMLLQSYTGTLHLLPALPQDWTSGKVEGLKAVGGYTVNMQWQDGRLTLGTITAAHDGPCQVRCKGLSGLDIRLGGSEAQVTRPDDTTIIATMHEGDVLTITLPDNTTRK